MSLADVPISLERFSAWFNDSVVKRKRVTYNIRDFIRDVVDKLVINCLNNVSRDSKTPLTISKFVVKSASLPGKNPIEDKRTYSASDLGNIIKWGDAGSDFTEYFFIAM